MKKDINVSEKFYPSKVKKEELEQLEDWKLLSLFVHKTDPSIPNIQSKLDEEQFYVWKKDYCKLHEQESEGVWTPMDRDYVDEDNGEIKTIAEFCFLSWIIITEPVRVIKGCGFESEIIKKGIFNYNWKPFVIDYLKTVL